MTAPAAILASSVSVRTLADGTLRLSVDIEPADAQAAFAAFGKPGSSIVVARVTDEAALAHDRQKQETLSGSAASQDGEAAFGTTGVSPSAPDRKPLALASRVALTCRQKSFHAFLRRLDLDRWDHAFVPSGAKEPDIERAATWVRIECCVGSRGAIVHGSPAAERWHTLEAEYELWQREHPAEAERHARRAAA